MIEQDKSVRNERRKFMAALHVTTKDFEREVICSDKPVLVDFWASWCGPCKMISPVIDKVADEVTDVKVCKVNVDEEPELARKYGVMSIPTLLLIKNGEVAGTSVGVKTKSEILEFIK